VPKSPKLGKRAFPVNCPQQPRDVDRRCRIVADLVRRGYMPGQLQRTDLHHRLGGRMPKQKKRRDRGERTSQLIRPMNWAASESGVGRQCEPMHWLSPSQVDMTKIVCTAIRESARRRPLWNDGTNESLSVAPNAGGRIPRCHRVATKAAAFKTNGDVICVLFHPNLTPFGDRELGCPFDLHFYQASVAPRALVQLLTASATNSTSEGSGSLGERQVLS